MDIVCTRVLPVGRGKQKPWYLLKSVIFHLVIIVCLGVSIHFTVSHFKVPAKNHQTLMATLVTSPSQTQANSTPILKLYRHGDVQVKNQIKHINIHTPEQQKHKTIKGQNLDKLVIYLYTKIAEHEIYPDESKALHQQGKALLRFKLFPNGRVADVTVVKSSGFELLDAAAVRTVESAAPFKMAGQYLKHADTFALPLVFKLG